MSRWRSTSLVQERRHLKRRVEIERVCEVRNTPNQRIKGPVLARTEVLKLWVYLRRVDLPDSYNLRKSHIGADWTLGGRGTSRKFLRMKKQEPAAQKHHQRWFSRERTHGGRETPRTLPLLKKKRVLRRTLGGRTCRVSALNFTYIYAAWACPAGRYNPRKMTLGRIGILEQHSYQ